MGVDRLDAADAARAAVHTLAMGIGDVDLMSDEAIAASLRRAASVLCPTTAGALVRAVSEVLAGLPGYTNETEANIGILVDSLVAYGDLLELSVVVGSRNAQQLFLGPPGFIPRASHTALLVGIRPEGAPLVGDDLLAQIEYLAHTRLIRSIDDRRIADILGPEDLIEIPSERWLNAPRLATPQETLAYYVSRLEAAGSSGEIEGLRLIDPASKVTYYKGRWRQANPRDEGQFVARRPQAFGADLWCFTQVVGGEVTRLIDLPLQAPLGRGADEAWRLQAAQDAIAGHPQRIRIREGNPTSLLEFFSPVPSWIQRRLDIVAKPLGNIRGAMFAYSLPHEELAEEVRFLGDMMWLSEIA